VLVINIFQKRRKFMSLDRRRFLTNTALTLATGILSGAYPKSSLASVPSESSNTNDLSDSWMTVREQFDFIAKDYIHLSSFFLASHPRPVREAIEKYRRALDDNPFLYLEERNDKPRVRESAAEYLGGKSDEVALTNNTTMGLALVYHGLPLKPGQEILTTEHDHFVHHESIRLSAERAGATVKKIKLYDDFKSISEEEIIGRIKKAVTPQTRVVGITWVHSSSGLKLPIRDIATAIAEINKGRDQNNRILLVVDGVHGFGVEDETIATTGVDFFISGTHKWIFGPRGTGIVWAKNETWSIIRPTIPSTASGLVNAWMTGTEPKGAKASWITPGGFIAFEHQMALPAAFKFHQQIGKTRVAERIHALNDQAKEEMAKMPKVKLYTPRGNKLSAGMICFDIEGMKPPEVVEKLKAKRIIASTSPYRISYARIAPSLLNTPEEIDTTLGHIRALV
jgi:isopenicillin-N epimerase